MSMLFLWVNIYKIILVFCIFFSSKIVIDNFLDASFINLKKNFKRKLIYVWSTRRINGLKDLISSWIDNISLLKNSELHIFGIEKNKLKLELNVSNLRLLTKSEL